MSVLTRMPQLATFRRRSTVAGSLALLVARHGVELAPACDIGVDRLKTRTIRAYAWSA